MAEIYVGGPKVNLQMVQLGAAYAYRQYLKQCNKDAYLNAETTAMRGKFGVWGPYQPDLKPWEFPRSRR